ncbi:MAG TPA: selenoneine synthase SenA [Ideonella sp.]|nr:selenoneine synthase SenA [Ideonella sp.]
MTDLLEDASTARHGDAAWLAAALKSSREDSLSTFAVVERSLASLSVPQRETLNPPLWELGHIGWFQEFWIGRNPLRFAGAAADPDAARPAGVRARSDALYDSSKVPHDTRWSLALPDAAGTREDLASQLAGTLDWLRDAGPDDDALYFFRLALFHEDMHHEAALYMAQSLGLAIEDPRWQEPALRDECKQLSFEAGPWLLGSRGAGFAFDNELANHPVELPATCIDSRVVSWADFLPFAEAGGYGQPRWWSGAGSAWIAAEHSQAPRYLRREGSAWQQWRHGTWRTLDMSKPACHLTAYEAEAWCRWAGRRLPTEAEWERAAVGRAGDFEWGQVWEWTASPFLPYAGFEPHPYRDYSAPWFGSRRVLRGGSFMTQPRMRHPRYRNFFMAQRNDVPAGFRSCAP